MQIIETTHILLVEENIRTLIWIMQKIPMLVQEDQATADDTENAEDNHKEFGSTEKGEP